MTTPENLGFILPVGTDFIRDGDDAISQNAVASAAMYDSLYQRISDKAFIRGLVTMNQNIQEDYYGSNMAGVWRCLSGTVCASLTGLPQDLIDSPDLFTLTVKNTGEGVILKIETYSVWGDAEYKCTSAPSTGTGWSRWKKTVFTEDLPEGGGGRGGGSGFKTLPLILTAGGGGGEALAPLTANVEYDVSLSPSIYVSRYRFAIRDGNPRWGTSTAQQISLSNISMGGVSKLSSMSTRSDGEISFSPWMSGNFGNLKFDYTAQQQPRYQTGGGLVNGARRTQMPFELWLEVEIPANTPAVAIVGDSNAVAVNATIPIHDAWISQYCRRMGFFPVIYGHSGDAMQSSGDPEHYKWNRWNHLDRADMVIHANGANDIPSTEGGATLAQMQEWARAEWAVTDEKVSKNKHGVVIKSRASGINNTLRVAYNNWIKSKPDPLRDWQDIASPVTTGDTGGLLPQYISSDAIHMNTAGQSAIANSPLKVMTVRTGLVFDQSVGRTVKAWDYLNQREQIIYGSTGQRRLSNADFTSGSFDLSREGDSVTLSIVSLKFASTGQVTITGFIPVGFRPGYVLVQGASKYWSTDTDGTARITPSGSFQVANVTANTQISLTVTWPTSEPWPTSLPGVAA